MALHRLLAAARMGDGKRSTWCEPPQKLHALPYVQPPGVCEFSYDFRTIDGHVRTSAGPLFRQQGSSHVRTE